jgi:uncharacterized heparinase superfamily protein
MQLSDRQRLLYLYLREGWRRFSRRLALGRISAMRFSGGTPDRLIVAPTDLHPADSFAGEEIVTGRFPLAGRVLDCEGESPFALELPSEEFAVRLHSFGWLRHMRLVDPEKAAGTARFIVDDWLQSHGRVIGGLAWRPDVTAQRIIAWLSHSPVVLKDADYPFYRRFLKNLAFQVRYLRHVADTTRDGEPRLRVRIALAMASIAMPTSASKMRRAARHLDEELDRQILPDGGHCSRNPRAALDVLLDLLPLRQTYVNLGHDMPSQLIPCIDRIFPALRFFRHQGGELALFNGATYTLANELMSALRYDETGGAPFKALPSLHYDRLAVKETVVLVDTGFMKSVELSTTAAAGTLAFEMSSGRNRFIINSGRPRFAGEAMRQMSRMTAAHSVATLDDTSSSRISTSKFLGPIIIGGVTKVDVSRAERHSGADGVTATHDGYLERFGLLYERDILLSASGGEIRGRERFYRPASPDGSIDRGTAVVRFHIHPAIQLYRVSPNETRLIASDGEAWALTSVDVPVEEEEDVFFADPSGVRASRQLTLTMPLRELPEVQWSLVRQR